MLTQFFAMSCTNQWTQAVSPDKHMVDVSATFNMHNFSHSQTQTYQVIHAGRYGLFPSLSVKLLQEEQYIRHLLLVNGRTVLVTFDPTTDLKE